MTSPISKTTLALAAGLLLAGTGAARADLDLVRLNHPNGPATYVFRPSASATTVAAASHGRSLLGSNSPTAVQAEASEERKLVLHQGRGQTRHVKVNR